jgi:NTE family protein
MKTALVLSAGGMFGAYEVGAWRFLSRELQPDLVVGSSVGTLNGWAIAGGCTADELAEFWHDPAKADAMRLRPPKLPWLSIFDPAALENACREIVSRYPLRLPLGVVLVEVPRLRARLFQEHLDARYLLASCAVPGGFPPVRIGEQLYVDGGLLSPLPLWAAAEMGASRIVAVNCLPKLPSRAIGALVRGVRRLATCPAEPGSVEIIRIEPSEDMGRLRDAVRWKRANVERWMAMGESDARHAWERCGASSRIY